MGLKVEKHVFGDNQHHLANSVIAFSFTIFSVLSFYARMPRARTYILFQSI